MHVRWGIPFFILLQGCLEKVEGIPKPLDPRFFKSDEQRADPNSGRGGASDPFASHTGEKVTVGGEVLSELEGSVDIDFRIPDPSVAGGMAGQGKLLMDAPGVFSLEVPKDIGMVEVQAFQDIKGDGPSSDDPFAQVEIQVEDEDLFGISITLVVGARSENPQGKPPPGPGGENPENTQRLPENPNPFAGMPGEQITITGTLTCPDCPPIDLDIFQPDENAPGGRNMIGKMKFSPGEYTIKIPENFGYIILEAFVDYNGDGPGEGDRMGSYIKNPLKISRSDVSNIDIELIIPEDGRMPMPPQSPQ